MIDDALAFSTKFGQRSFGFRDLVICYWLTGLSAGE
jgi:hypothetical protein